jgi:predicted nucleic acid-binding protein
MEQRLKSFPFPPIRSVLCGDAAAVNSYSGASCTPAARIVAVSHERFVLDTSALLTLIEDEAGAERVEYVLTNGQVWLPWLTLYEATFITQQACGKDEADRRYALLEELPVTILWEVEEEILLIAADIRGKFPISLPDAIIAAHAIQKNATLLHKDPDFESLTGHVLLEALPYNGNRVSQSNGWLSRS